MPKLNFYDTDAVKAFLLNTLVENKEAREDVDQAIADALTLLTGSMKTEGGAAK